MARPLRIEFAGGCYHVINRGNYRRWLFGGGGAEAFERVLGEAAVRFGWLVHAYVIMSNHFHLALELGEPNLSDGMKWLQGTWIRRYNSFRHLVGRPFQGRYKALVVAPGAAFGNVCHYIHLNPVRARLCAASAVAGHAWSSLPKFLGKRPFWLDPTTVLAESGDLPDTPAGWRSYLQYLEFLATDDLARKELVAEKMSRGWCVGDRQFKEDIMRQAMKERGAAIDRFAGLEPADARAERARAWEDRLQALAGTARIALEALPRLKSHPDKALLAAAMKATTSVSNQWLAERLGMGASASASQFARRLLLQREGRLAVGQLLSRVKT